MTEDLVAPGASPAPGPAPDGAGERCGSRAARALVRAYYVEDGHAFDEARQPAALVALAAGEPCARAWLIRLAERAVGYVVRSWTFSVEAGGREACLDELYLEPEARNRGLGSRVLELVDAEARARGARRLFLEVERHNRAIALYRRAGYVDHGRFLMSKLLDR